MWIPANRPPQIEPGTLLPVAVARKSTRGDWYVFGAHYLNRYAIDECDDEDDECLLTGFSLPHKHPYYSEYFQIIDVLYWHPLPDPPTEEAIDA